jgi:murein DD-endopeptidase MepM/ murein hydrolase activator NlpD
MRALALALRLCLGSGDAGLDPDPPDAGSEALPPRDPAEVKRLLEEERARLNALLDRQQSLLDTVDVARAAVVQAEGSAREAELAERAAKVNLQRAGQESEAAQAALTARIVALRPRLAARYRLSRGGAAALLFGADSLGDLLWRRRTLTRVLAADLELLRAARQERARLLVAQEAQLQSAVEVKARHAERQQQLTQARKRRDELGALLAALSDQRSAKEKLVEELTQAASRIDALAQAPVGFSPRVPFEKQKGRLPRPASGVIEVGFGRVVDPQFQTVLIQKGVDLRADAGTPVIAVAHGRVVHAGTLRGYGNLVILDHGQGYFTLYAHLEKTERQIGEVLAPGDRIGGVGETGSLKGPFLYFEIRHHGTPLDPALWLRK